VTLEQLQQSLAETDILGLTAWAEARGDFNQGNSSVEERIAVMSVIRNRVADPAWWGTTYRTVCLKSGQFSCWLNNPNDANHLALMILATQVALNKPTGDQVWDETRFLAEGIRRGFILDRTKGSDHYYAPKAMKPAGSVPKWAKDAKTGLVLPPDAIVGDQHFYKLGPAA
jgi:N-acetylmuramoyl-L-alanine amidase